MAEITINIDDYMTPDDIKVECMATVRQAVFNMYGRNENEIRRLITNLSYEFIFKAVSDCIGEDAKSLIVNKVKELLEKDVAFKQKFYYAKGAHYETATLENIMLVPGERIHKELEDDYQAMRNMIYGNIPEFKDILMFLERLQEEIHGL